MTQQQSTMTLLRHGLPESSQSEQIFRGVTDDLLTELGWQQMTNALNSLTALDLVISSPLRRCYDFAHKLAIDLNLPLQVFEELKEINFGQWDGQSIQQIELDYADKLKKFWQNPIENTPPNGESVLDFQQRVINCWNNILTENKGKNCLFIIHGGVQKIILAQILEMPVNAIHNIEVPYACSSTIQIYYSETGYVSTLKSHGKC